MDKLTHDEILLIFMKFKEDYEKKLLNYEKKINDLTNKCATLEGICWEELYFNMTDNYKCDFCCQNIYKGVFYDENNYDNTVLSYNYIECSICNKKSCHDCEKENSYVAIYQGFPIKKIFYCNDCYNN